jgi:hypothetical protein
MENVMNYYDGEQDLDRIENQMVINLLPDNPYDSDGIIDFSERDDTYDQEMDRRQWEM